MMMMLMILMMNYYMVQTVHTLKASDIQAVAGRATLRGRVRHSISQAIVGQPSNIPADLRTQVTVFDLLRSRKMVLYMAVMCALWYALRFNEIISIGIDSLDSLKG